MRTCQGLLLDQKTAFHKRPARYPDMPTWCDKLVCVVLGYGCVFLYWRALCVWALRSFKRLFQSKLFCTSSFNCVGIIPEWLVGLGLYPPPPKPEQHLLRSSVLLHMDPSKGSKLRQANPQGALTRQNLHRCGLFRQKRVWKFRGGCRDFAEILQNIVCNDPFPNDTISELLKSTSKLRYVKNYDWFGFRNLNIRLHRTIL